MPEMLVDDVKRRQAATRPICAELCELASGM